ncbi:biopolymer transporter ExbD [Bacteroidia bacterium]|nr:biopolymer transporter ExbD [Bacteroidia bacterium]GHT05188.1 biopolymer transporter ExbD [Bacteroidia bacterium]GHT50037.1 biopolymer transporter ExbD [Bacteroidia bacterium]
MSRFRKTEPRTVPVLNTASLPDMVFTLLFFFMIVTNIRTVPVMTQFNLPSAVELQKLEEKSLIVYVMVGKGTPIQLNSNFITLEEMPAHLKTIQAAVPEEDQGKMIAVLKVDKDIPMGMVNDIKQNLREAHILTIHYSAEKKRSK